MIHRLFLLSLFLLAAFGCFAQTENVDSLPTELKLLPDSLSQWKIPTTTPANTAKEYYYPRAEYRLFRMSPLFASEKDSSALALPDVASSPGQVTPYSWKGGTIFVTGGTARYPGLMNIDSGAIGVYQRFGDFSLSASGIVNNYGYFRGVHTQYGINGNVSYYFSPNLSATVFVTYYFGTPPVMGGGLPMPPAMAGYYGTSSFGGYIDYRVNDKFGVQVGGQTVQQIGTNHYRMEPIVTPYVKVGKIGIGLPVGQIVNGLIRSNIENRRRR
ncbi:MAG: hypothetical protein HDS68_09405 [Bacteroidales bacterium]|nr:hypothetical protein [Bacteroidales bacterium]